MACRFMPSSASTNSSPAAKLCTSTPWARNALALERMLDVPGAVTRLMRCARALENSLIVSYGIAGVNSVLEHRGHLGRVLARPYHVFVRKLCDAVIVQS